MLFTKIALDDFESCLARFLERVSEHCLLTSRCGDDWSSLGTGTSAPWGDSEWFMVAVINISAMLQYGADDGVLKKAMNKDSSAAPTKPSSSTLAKQSKTPQAIMLNPSALKRSDLSPTDAGEPTANVLKQLNQTTEEHPLVFRLAQRLTFSILSVLLQHPYRRIGNSQVLNPYIVLLLTFISHMAQTPGALQHLEQAVPWRQIVNFLNMVPVDVEVRMDVQSKLVGGPLPEDWCVRGMDWTGRNLFGRGFWRASATGASASMAPPPMGESLESEMEALKFDITTIDEDTSAVPLASVTLALRRWKRVAVVAAWLARNVPGLDFDEGVVGSGIKPRFVLGGSLEAKLKRWKKEAQEAAEVERLSRITAWARLEDVEIEEEEESDEEDDEDPSDSIEVRDLKVSLVLSGPRGMVLMRVRIGSSSSTQGSHQAGSPRDSQFSRLPTSTVDLATHQGGQYDAQGLPRPHGARFRHERPPRVDGPLPTTLGDGDLDHHCSSCW
jgi:protein SMG6